MSPFLALFFYSANIRWLLALSFDSFPDLDFSRMKLPVFLSQNRMFWRSILHPSAVGQWSLVNHTSYRYLSSTFPWIWVIMIFLIICEYNFIHDDKLGSSDSFQQVSIDWDRNLWSFADWLVPPLSLWAWVKIDKKWISLGGKVEILRQVWLNKKLCVCFHLDKIVLTIPLVAYDLLFSLNSPTI